MSVVAIGRPTTDDALIQDMVAHIKDVLAEAERGDLSGLVIVAARPDQTFRLAKLGVDRRLQTVGFLMQAVHDLLAEG